jgi:mRNA interferase RelE/StbE
MASSRIEFQRSAEKDLKRLGREHTPRILDEIKSLEAGPFPVGARKLVGSDRTYRIRVGDYRVIYQVIPPDLILVTRVRHRRDVYRD